MNNDLTTKRPAPKRHESPDTAASRLKRELMTGARDRMFGDDGQPAIPAEGELPRVIIACANDAPTTLDSAKKFQREMFDAAGGPMEMKFAYYGADDDEGLRVCRITTRWISDADEMGGIMSRVHCECGCYVSIRRVLAAAVKENNKDRPVQCVVVIGDAFHDDPEDLDEAALCAAQLRKAGTKLFLFQDSDDPQTARKLQRLAAVSGGVYFPRTPDMNVSEVLQAISVYSTGGEAAVKAKSSKGAMLLLEKLAQEPMPIIEEREAVKVKSKGEMMTMKYDPIHDLTDAFDRMKRAKKGRRGKAWTDFCHAADAVELLARQDGVNINVASNRRWWDWACGQGIRSQHILIDVRDYLENRPIPMPDETRKQVT